MDDLVVQNADDAEMIWRKEKSRIRKSVDEIVYTLWFHSVCFVKFNKAKNSITLGAPDMFYMERFKKNGYLEQIQNRIQKTYGLDVRLTCSCEAVKLVKKEIEAHINSPYPRNLFPLPTDLCRTTFCKAIERKDLRSLKYSFDQVHKTRWGTLTFHGPDCGMLEEDFLIAILKLWIENEQKMFRCHYSDILDLLGYKRGKNGKHQTSNVTLLKETLERLQKTSFRLEVNSKNGKNNKKNIAASVLKYGWDDEDQKLWVEFDEWFVTTLVDGFITGIDLDQRNALGRAVISKALHRHISSHGMEWVGPWRSVAESIQINPNLEDKKIRDRLRTAIKKLVRVGFLSENSKLKGKNILWYRVAPALSGHKLIKEIEGRG